ncbi:ATP-binding cassette domain-containing protein [Kaistella flava (ex Peng et al. 2021)]|uniref:ATP-binding cassette domain-containing protein n=1 Tax=Kaistella flava (ex Peng et al. 2021) TaxID=2038776 RepID=A0A7M2YD17_9FLAO|nr:ATP-binding cassette domain-containing protein [Kaistella flava (ex Peng et al. 2021)]
MLKLHVDSIDKSFDDKKILKDIFLSCETGQIVGILGRNGSGKSTLLEIIFGTISAENKFVRVGTKVINNVSDNKNLIHYLFQGHFLPNHLKVKSIIDLFCNSENAVILKSNELMIPFINQKTRNLSGGEKRLIEILVLLFSDCKFLILDEPFHSPKIIEEIKKLIKKQSKNKGIIITDHQYKNIIEISDKIILLKNGSTKIVNGIDDLKKFGYLQSY